MKKAIIIVLIIALAIILVACGPSKLDQKKAQIIGKMLKMNNVSYIAISSNGDRAEIIYESSEANKYDAQMVSDWGMIFASAANFGYKEIIIVNTINYMPAAKLMTNSENVKALGNGEINESVFWENVEIEAVD